MTNDFTSEVIRSIQKLYKTDNLVRTLFDWTAGRERDASSTSIDHLCRKLDISRGEAVALARSLEKAQCGKFVVGRRRQKSRFEWHYSCISLGRAAAEESAELEQVENPVADDEDEISGPHSNAMEEQTPIKLSISEAKAALALSLGVPITNIEIIVKG